MRKDVIIFGYSGHSYEIINLFKNQNYDVVGYFELENKKSNPFSIRYLGFERQNNLKNIIENKNTFICIGDNFKRLELSKIIKINSGILINAIHSSSKISDGVIYGEGNFIAKNTSINYNTVLKDNIIINTSAVIEHDCKIESGSHIGPGAVICGGVNINKGSFIGANSVIKENINIGKNVLIGAGSVVTKDIPDYSIAYGNPLKLRK